MEEKIRVLDGILTRASLPTDSVVYRGISGNGATALMAAGLGKGHVIRDPGFMSTSRNAAAARLFAEQSRDGLVAEIRASKGAKALDIASVSDAGAEEAEVLIARQSRLKVLSWDRTLRTLVTELLSDE